MSKRWVRHRRIQGLSMASANRRVKPMRTRENTLPGLHGPEPFGQVVLRLRIWKKFINTDLLQE